MSDWKFSLLLLFQSSHSRSAFLPSRFKNTPVYIDCPLAEQQAIAVPVHDIQLPQKTITQLNNIDPFDDEEQGPFKCSLTIASIINTTNWWYMSCELCKKKAEQQQDGSYKCSKCQASTIIPRYLISFIGKDDTAEARFFAYDDEAQRLVQKNCQAVVNPLRARDGLPQAIQNIVGKTYVLSVDLTDESCKSSRNRQYQVKAVLERPSKSAPAKKTPLTHYDPVQSSNSDAVTDSPHSQNEVLQIEPAIQMTPTAGSEQQTEISKETTDRLPATHSNVRRSLFTSVDETDTEKSEAEKHHDNLRPVSSEPSPKRSKTLSADKAAEHHSTT